MITDAVWQDLDNDQYPELIVTGEWSEIQFFKNTKGTLAPMIINWVNESDHSINTTGWWNTIKSGDFDEFTISKPTSLPFKNNPFKASCLP